MAYADDVDVIGDDIRTIEKKNRRVVNSCKNIGLAANSGKTKYMEVGRHQDRMVNQQIYIGSNSYKKVEILK